MLTPNDTQSIKYTRTRAFYVWKSVSKVSIDLISSAIKLPA